MFDKEPKASEAAPAAPAPVVDQPVNTHATAIFVKDEAYQKAREAIDFTQYAKADELEDGEAKQQLRTFEDRILVAREDLRLAQNPDILAGIAHDRPNDRIVVVGFAAETGDEEGTVLDHARAKLARKGCDLLVVNDVGGGKVFGEDENEAVVLGADGSNVPVPRGSKAALAHVIWDRVTSLLQDR